ncbi:dcm methylase [Paraburkholderia phosphatilytica]|uniref:dcm methylase n=1 Tax=Paraburkholderia phosphatilytica TaxID=2282883 RepID=UPI000E4752B7|nr:dcm methylase [Paraburkholderia phosphatilytica]
MSKGTVIALCNLTMNFVQPWLDAGYRVVMVDPQHERSEDDGQVFRIKGTIDEVMPALLYVIKNERVVFVAGFPPCTDVAVSGSRWFASKRKKDPHFQAKAALVAEQCRTIAMLTGAKWFFENPVSVFASIFGKPSHTFHPCDFTAYCADDNYTKKTCLWTGGGFVMPSVARDATLGAPDDRIHKAPPGPERANFRSATPRGFARAVFLANAPCQKICA